MSVVENRADFDKNDILVVSTAGPLKVAVKAPNYLASYVGNSTTITPRECGGVGDNVHDDTECFEEMLASGKAIQLQKGQTYKITDTLTLPAGRTIIHCDGATIAPAFGTAYSTALFSNNKDTDASTTLVIMDPRIIGNCVAFDMRFTADNPNAGLSLKCHRLYANTNDGNRRAGTKVFLLDQIDFVDIHEIEAWNYDLFASVNSPSSSGRNSTQFNMRNVSANQVSSGMKILGLSKGLLQNIDFMKCNSGFSFEGEVANLELRYCHAEAIAMDGYASASSDVDASSAGVGFNFVDSVQARGVRLVQCDTIDTGGTGGTAVASLRVGKQESAAPTIQDIELHQCSFATAMCGSGSYSSIVNRGRFRWRGPWPYTDLSLSANGLGYIDADIEADYGVDAPNTPLLLGDTVLSLINGSGGAAPTIAETALSSTSYYYGHQVTFNSVYDLVRNVGLPYGWCTLDVIGYRVSGNPLLIAAMVDSPFTDRVRIQFNGLNDHQRRWRIPFWNPTAGQTHKVGLASQNASGDVCVIQAIAVYGGLPKRNFPFADWHIVDALPTPSLRWQAKKMIVRAAATDDAYHVCILNASSAFEWKEVTLT